MEEILTGLSGRQYRITTHIKSGGEGAVYNTDDPGLVAKIYDISRINIDARMAEMEQKIRYMVAHRIPTRVPDGTVIVTWPQDVLYRNGLFVGYVMPKVSGAKPIYMINRGGRQANEVIPGYNWLSAILVAANLSYIVSYLHSKNVVIGDMNSDNLLVYPNGFVVVIDTDSFDIRDESIDLHYKCSVGTEEFLPPELQGCNLERKSVYFTKHTDEFALAVHIFQLLMNNMHPFNARVITDYKQSLPENHQNYNIIVGNCPFVRKIDGCDIPLGAPYMNELLPDYVIQDFKNTFDYRLDQSDPAYMSKLKTYAQQRTSAAEWHKHLMQLSREPDFVQCSNNPEHYYLAGKGHCELCEARNRLMNNSPHEPKPKPTPPPKPKRKKFIFGLTAAVLIAVCIGFQPLMKYLDYQSALHAYNVGNYEKAAEQFEELGYYKNSHDNWIDSMINYINAHYNNTDYTTYFYMMKLDKLGYDVAEYYEELYSWKVEEAIMNYESEDHETDLEYLENDDKWYVHFKFKGGVPGETLSVYTVRKKGEGSRDLSDYDADYKKEYEVKDSSWIDDGLWSYTVPSKAGDGTWTMAVFLSDDDSFMFYISIPHYE